MKMPWDESFFVKCASYKDKYVYILMELRINKICNTEISTSHRLGHVLDTKFPGVIFIAKDLVYLPFLSEVIIKCDHTIVSPSCPTLPPPGLRHQQSYKLWGT